MESYSFVLSGSSRINNVLTRGKYQLTEQNTSELDQVNTSSAPSELRITDMRIAVVGGDGWRWPIIKLETVWPRSTAHAYTTSLALKYYELLSQQRN